MVACIEEQGEFSPQQFEKTMKGDFVIYDSQAKLLAYNPKSQRVSEIPLYNELEEREVKNQLASFSYSHDLGLNEAPNRNPYTGF